MRAGLLAFVAFAVMPGVAQSPPGLRGNGGSAPGSLGWVTIPSVQAELKLTPEQAEKVQRIARDFRAQYERKRQTLADLPLPDRMKKLVAFSDEQYAEGMEALAIVLDPGQLDRFDQILFQMRGVSAMLEPGQIRALELSDSQRKQLNEVVRSAREEQSKLIRASKGDAPDVLEGQVRANAREHLARAVLLLHDEQKLTWERISGPPFEKKLGEMIVP